MTREISLTPEQKKWVESEVEKRKTFQVIAGDDDSEMLAETHKEVIRALNKLDKDTAGKTQDDFDVLVNIIHRSMFKSLLKANQEKWRTECIMKASEVVTALEKKPDISVREKFTVKINKNYIKLLQDLKLGGKSLGTTKKDFEKALKIYYVKAADTDLG